MNHPPQGDVPEQFKLDLHATPFAGSNTLPLMCFSMAPTATEEPVLSAQLAHQMGMMDVLKTSGWRTMRPTMKPHLAHSWSAVITDYGHSIYLTLNNGPWPSPFYEGRIFPDASIPKAREWMQRLASIRILGAYVLYEAGPLPDYDVMLERMRANQGLTLTTRTRLQGVS